MQDLFEAASEVQSRLRIHGLKFCFIGGVALQRWGETRLTADIDLSVFTEFVRDESTINLLLGEFEGRISAAKDHALAYRVLLLKHKGVGLDVGLAGFEFELEVIERGSDYEFLPGLSLFTCSAEDLVVMKAFASRGKDWEDISGILVRQKGKLDWSGIWSRIEPLAEIKEDPEIITRLKLLRS